MKPGPGCPSLLEASPAVSLGGTGWPQVGCRVRELSRFMRFVPLVLASLGTVADLAAQPAAARDPRPPPTPYRVEEDWTFLRDPARRTDPVDRVKFIPLGPPEARASLTLGGEARHRWENYWSDAWGAIPDDENGYHLLRLNLFADVRVDGRWRTFVEIKSGLAEGKTAPVKPPEEDRLDLHQAFVEWKGDSPVFGDARLLVRLGRQELNYGGMRILTFRDGPNVRQSFDAALARVQRGGWKIDAFYARPAETDDGSFDDQTNDQQLIYGLYGVTPLQAIPGANLDLYLLGYDRDNGRFPSGVGNERRYSAGARFWGRRAALDYNFEALWQWGEFRADRIQAWTIASDTGYTLATAPGKPRLYLKANVISGDRRAGDGRLDTFNALYPRGAYFGDIGLIGPANLLNLHPGVLVQLAPRWSLHVDSVLYWRESRADGVYNAGGALVRLPGGSRARNIGTQADVSLSWNRDRHLSVELAVARFWAGRFLAETGPAEDVDYLSLLTRYRF